MTGFVVMIFAVTLQSISINLSMLNIARSCIGFGAAITHDVAPELVMELVQYILSIMRSIRPYTIVLGNGAVSLLLG